MERGQKTYYRATCQLCTTNVISFCSAYPVPEGIGCPHLYIQRRHNLKVNTKGVRTLPSVSFSDPKRLNNSAPLSLFYSDRWGNGKNNTGLLLLFLFFIYCSFSFLEWRKTCPEVEKKSLRHIVSETRREEVPGIRCLSFSLPAVLCRRVLADCPSAKKETQFSCR